ncbi:MAG TPA: PDGLE domain-containing protein, partial [Ilumatobacteraceae bacterium]|nr:PDGLE domain-containing protein [Ilumatobacteraceae bacterium]
SGLAAVCSVVLAAVAFSIEWLFGASAPVPFDRVFGAMVGVHALIGLGEGVITAGAIGAVLGSRPDLVAGAHDLSPEQSADRGGLGLRPFVIGGCIVALVCASVIGQFAFDNPDGLERVAIDHGFAQAGTDHALASSPLADYATQGVGNETVSLAIAGAVGVALSLIVISGVLAATRPLRRRGAPA